MNNGLQWRFVVINIYSQHGHKYFASLSYGVEISSYGVDSLLTNQPDLGLTLVLEAERNFILLTYVP